MVTNGLWMPQAGEGEARGEGSRAGEGGAGEATGAAAGEARRSAAYSRTDRFPIHICRPTLPMVQGNGSLAIRKPKGMSNPVCHILH
jgi:hypothetical protein